MSRLDNEFFFRYNIDTANVFNMNSKGAIKMDVYLACAWESAPDWFWAVYCCVPARGQVRSTPFTRVSSLAPPHNNRCFYCCYLPPGARIRMAACVRLCLYGNSNTLYLLEYVKLMKVSRYAHSSALSLSTCPAIRCLSIICLVKKKKSFEYYRTSRIKEVRFFFF